jgi:F420-0:gamma-glutamyl ligase
MKIEIFGLRLPEVKPGDDLVKLIIGGLLNMLMV